MKIKYQFNIDGQPSAPVRDTWDKAIQDAINAGMCAYYGGGDTDMSEGATIDEWNENETL